MTILDSFKANRGWMRISKKLPLLFLLVSVLSIVPVSLVTSFYFSTVLEERAVARLEAVGHSRSLEIRRELDAVVRQTSSYAKSKNAGVILNEFSRAFSDVQDKEGNALESLQAAYISNNPNPVGQKHLLNKAEGNLAYHEVHNRYHDIFLTMWEQTGFYDIFLVDREGNIVYSVFKEPDFADNLFSGRQRETGLARIAQKISANPVKGKIVFDDFESYAPSNGAPASFLGAPVFNDGIFAGAFIIQMPVGRLNDIVGNVAGLGESGDSVLVGSDRLMRTDSRFVAQGQSSILSQSHGSSFIASALDGKSGVGSEKIDGRGEFFSFYAPIDFQGVRWVLVLDTSVSEALAEIAKVRGIILSVGGGVLVLVVVLGLLFARSIVRPLTRSTHEMRQLADGDHSIDISGADRGDEMGDMARALDVFKASALRQEEMAAQEQAMVRQREERAERVEKLIARFSQRSAEVLDSVAGMATQMLGTSDELLKTASEASTTATAVAAAAEQASANVSSVASATEELNTSIGGVNTKVTDSRLIADEAIDAVGENLKTIQQLDEASGQIGEVVEMISDIAEQTNLLALNATIEAARAGDMGKGFAVVASEVKNLASKTAKATEDISSQIAEVQQVTKSAVDAVNGIGARVRRMSEASDSAAEAVNQQAEATAEISRAVQEVSDGTSEVTGNILGVSSASERTDQAARSVSQVAGDLSNSVVQIRELVEEFSHDIKEA